LRDVLQSAWDFPSKERMQEGVDDKEGLSTGWRGPGMDPGRDDSLGQKQAELGSRHQVKGDGGLSAVLWLLRRWR
jgi:hypothetical protein